MLHDGRYIQQLFDAATGPPAWANAKVPDGSRKPNDRGRSLSDEGFSLTAKRIDFGVDEYEGPYGKGYIVKGRVKDGATVYEKAQHVGDDPGHTSYDWRAL